jgi:hypothetical protein
MKRILFILVLLSTTMTFTQTKTFESEVRKISKRIGQITKEEKDSLKIKITEIKEKLDKGAITENTAQSLKMEVANYHAKKIEKRVGAQEQLLQQLVQDKTDGKMASVEDDDFEDDKNTFTIGHKSYKFSINENKKKKGLYERDEHSKEEHKRNRSTTTQFVFAGGVNNLLINDHFSSLDNTEYEFWQSHFYEIGFTWKSRLNKEASQLYFKYGFSFLWNNLRLKNNQYHVVNGERTDLDTYPSHLSDSRLRHVQMTFPVHLEWDFSKNKIDDDGFVEDRTGESFRFGIGVFGGFKLGSRQYLEYVNAAGIKVEELQKGDFNMNTINYGLSSYLAYKSLGLYVKYDLNPLFRNTSTNNISMGIRFDFN